MVRDRDVVPTPTYRLEVLAGCPCESGRKGGSEDIGGPSPGRYRVGAWGLVRDLCGPLTGGPSSLLLRPLP